MRFRKEDKKNLAIGFVVGGVLAMMLPSNMNPFFMLKQKLQEVTA